MRQMRLTFLPLLTSLPTRITFKLFVLSTQVQQTLRSKVLVATELIKTVADYDTQFGASGGSSGVTFGTYAARFREIQLLMVTHSKFRLVTEPL